MVSIFSLLKTVDMFGYEHKIRYKNDYVQKTACGGVVTIFATVSFFFILIFFGRELFDKKDPIVSFGEQQEDTAKVPLRALGNFIMFVDGSGNFVHTNPAFYKSFEIQAIKLEVNNVQGGASLVETPIEIIPCNDELIADEAIDDEGFTIIKSIGLCLNAPITDEIVNEFGSLNSVSYIVRLKLCDEAKNPGCRAFFKTLYNFQAVIYRRERFFNPEDFNNPIGSRIFTSQTDISEGIKIIRNQVIQVNEALTDDSILFSVSDSQIFYSTSDTNTQVKLTKEFGESIETTRDVFEVRFETTKLKKTFRRRYLKIQELIAFVGGFIKGILVLGAIVGKMYGKYFFLRQNLLVDFPKLVAGQPERQTSVVIRKANQSSDELVVEDRKVSGGRINLWNFLIGQVSSSYLKKRNIDYSSILNKFDVYYTYQSIRDLEAKVIQLETINNNA